MEFRFLLKVSLERAHDCHARQSSIMCNSATVDLGFITAQLFKNSILWPVPSKLKYLRKCFPLRT